MDEPVQRSLETSRRSLLAISTVAPILGLGATASAQGGPPQTQTIAPTPVLHDGQNDFDFIIGDWKAHVRRLPDRLNGSTAWIEYEGTSSHQKLFGGPANLEEFKVKSLDGKLSIHAQTLRLYNADSHQWSIYLVDVTQGNLGVPPVVGEFHDGQGVFYDQELYKGRAIFVRYQWFNISPLACRMEQSFSADGGQSWETNWICALSRVKAA